MRLWSLMMNRFSKMTATAFAGILLHAGAASAEEPAAEKKDDETTSEHVQEATRSAADAVVGAGERVSAKIQGKRGGDGELAPGMRTNTGLGYGTAGCGLGSILFTPGSGFTQVFAATTNGTFGTQTFGITSGTSNCAPSHTGRGAARAFVETNRGALSKDIARGRGETITSLSKLAGCAEPAHVGAHLQQRFDAIFPTAASSDRDVSEAVVSILRADPSLGCRELS
jgi:DUF3015 family protein